MADAVDPGDVMKILITTDNHMGYLERNDIRGQDSFTTFEEIMQVDAAR